MNDYKEIVLQERRTLDDVLRTSIRTFNNGCNFRLVKGLDENYYLEYGCYGVLVNLVTGDERLLMLWMKDYAETMKMLSGSVQPETIHFLLTQEPCKLCGGARFRYI